MLSDDVTELMHVANSPLDAYIKLIFEYFTDSSCVCSKGRTPMNALRTMGTYTQPGPNTSEIGLRMLIGAAAREAAMRGLAIEPVFSLYAPHGPVFRTMLRVQRHKSSLPDPLEHYNFLAFSRKTGAWTVIQWQHLCSSDDRSK